MSLGGTSPATPRRPGTAAVAERLNNVRSGLAQLQQTVQGTQSFSTIGSLASPSPGNMLRPTTATRQVASDSGIALMNKPSSAGSAAMRSDAAAGNNANADSPRIVGGGAPSSAASWSAPSAGGVSSIDEKFAFYQLQAQKIEQLLTNEVRRRTEGDKLIQQHIEARAREMVQAVEKKFSEKLIHMHVSVDGVTKQLEKLQHELAVEREKNVRLTQEVKYFATKGVEDIRDAMTQEKNHRIEKEGLLQKKLSEELVRLQERLDVEKHARETMVKAARDEIARAGKQREKSDERVLTRMREDLQILKANYAAEVETREKGEEQLAAAMEDLVSQVQLGLNGLVR